jgi:predicted metal-dependent peptidase
MDAQEQAAALDAMAAEIKASLAKDAAAERAAAARMTKARTQLILRQPFFGTLAMRLKYSPDWTRPTAATDGRRLIYNPDFILTLTLPAVMGLIAHEICHCLFDHQGRRGTRDPKLFNIAGDFAINPMVADVGQDLELPPDCLMDPDFAGMTVEEIYSKIKLPDEPPPPTRPSKGPEEGDGQGAGKPDGDDQDEPQDGPGEPQGDKKTITPPTDPAAMPGDVLDDPGPDPDDPDQDDTPWETDALQARNIARQMGNMPAKIDAAITDKIKPTYTVADIVRRFVTESLKSNSTWRRPNKKFKAHGLTLPSLETPAPSSIAVMLDCSGSIAPAQIAAAVDAAAGIADELRTPLIIIACNSQVTHYQRFEPGEPVNISIGTGGGTDFRPPFERLAEEGETPTAAVYISADLCGTFPEPQDEPPYPVAWISEPLGDYQIIVPFGEHHQVLKPEPRG